MRNLKSCLNQKALMHIWVPNLFEFKGGIQVYLQDFLDVLAIDSSTRKFKVFDKLDKNYPHHGRYQNNFSFEFSGSIPKVLQTPHFAFNLVLRAFLERPDFIICGLITFGPIAALLNQWLGIPYWLVVYGIDVWNIKDPLRIQALYRASQIIAISSYTRDRLIQEHDLLIEKITLLPVTFDSHRFAISHKPDYLLSRYGFQNNQLVILSVTRLASQEGYKGYDRILQAMPKIRNQIPNVHYLLVGKGDDRPRIEQQITDLGLTDCVTLAGFVPDNELCDHYNLCDVFALPSQGEGFGIVYLEALACGKPTLGGNQDGAIDALCHGDLGALVNPDDIEEIAQTLIQILQGTYPNPLMYKPDQLRQKVIETYGFEKFKHTLATYLAESGL